MVCRSAYRASGVLGQTDLLQHQEIAGRIFFIPEVAAAISLVASSIIAIRSSTACAFEPIVAAASVCKSMPVCG